MHRFFALLFFGFGVPGEFVEREPSQEKAINTYSMTLPHPALKPGMRNTFDLKEWGAEGNKQRHYSMVVDSVICTDNLCKIDPVTLSWDQMGEFITYRLEPHIRLEKHEGKPFKRKDYRTLNRILKDSDSPFKTLSYHELTNTRVHGEVDGITGATKILLDQGQSIQGAAWTCYSLWHWAHGEVVKHIRMHSARTLPKNQLLKLLNSQNNKKLDYAFEALLETHFDLDIWHTIKAQKNTVKKESYKHLIFYTNKAPKNEFNSIFNALLSAKNKESKNNIFDHLTEFDAEKQVVIRQNLATLVNKIRDYRDLDLLLRWYEQLEKPTEAELDLFSGLLNTDRISARRVYWFLSEYSLSPKSQERRATFEEQNKAFL